MSRVQSLYIHLMQEQNEGKVLAVGLVYNEQDPDLATDSLLIPNPTDKENGKHTNRRLRRKTSKLLCHCIIPVTVTDGLNQFYHTRTLNTQKR